MSGHLLTRRRLLLATPALAFAATAKAAPPTPTGPVILTVSGQIGITNSPQGFEFDMAMLAALPQHEFRTRTPWHTGTPQFTGPLLRTVLDTVQAKGHTVRAVALNDYKVDIPASDAKDWDVIVARLVDGQPMRVRDRGPLFIIYPFDSKAELRDPRYTNRSAWQLRRIEVV